MNKPSNNESSLGQYIADPVAHFKSIPWCAALLEDKRILSTMVPDRTPVASTESSLVNTTINSASTVRACMTFLRAVKNPSDEKKPLLEIVALVDLGDGMNGYAKTLHGGFSGVLLDEVMSVAANQQTEHGAYTRSLNITYNRPIRTPQVIVARGVAVGQDGRKILVKGYLEDSKSRVLAEADALWLAMQYNLRETSKL